MTPALRVVLGAVVLASSFAAAQAANPDPAPPEGLPPGMTEGPAKVKLGGYADLQVGEGTIFGDAMVTKALLEKSGNLTSGRELGILLKDGSATIFEFDEVGYVKDDDKDALDPDKMLTSLRENQERANEELARLKRPQLELPRWQVKPHYDPVTHNLEWGPIVRNKETQHESVNYNVRMLGRRGVMEVTLIVVPEKLDSQLPWFRETLKGFTFVAGEDYASWRQGDKVAAYGLAALVTGGVVAAAAKSGLLAKFWKPIALGLAALAAGAKKFFGGNKAPSITDDSAPKE